MARQTAGIEIKPIGLAPLPTNLQYLKEGNETMGLGYDAAVRVCELLDQASREFTRRNLPGLRPKVRRPAVAAQGRLTFDPSKGWSGYPDFAERFAKLWVC